MLDLILNGFKPKPPLPRPPGIVELLARFNRPWLLRWFGLINGVAALFYGLLATYGLLARMFPDVINDHNGQYGLADMVQLMERSATHTALAGAAFAVAFITQAAAIVTARNDPPPPAEKLQDKPR